MSHLHAVNLASESIPRLVWERQMRPAIDAVETARRTGHSIRAVVMGNAGSGKSTMLRHLHRLLLDDDRGATLVNGADVDATTVPRSHVLLIDDLHLAPNEHVEHIRRWCENPDAALVVSSRPWPSSSAVMAVARRLEQSGRAIVLGHVTRSDVLTLLEQEGEQLPHQCLEHILAVTAGVSWLVSEALDAHDPRDCARDPAHHELDRALHERIAYRLDTVNPELRRAIRARCLGVADAQTPPHEAERGDDEIMQGYAEGLLLRNGAPIPLVRSAVQAAVPMHRLVESGVDLASLLAADPSGALRGSGDDGSGHLPDVRLGRALVANAERLLDGDPRRASELYLAALRCGVPAADVAAARAQAAWASGGIDDAARILDSVRPDGHTRDLDLYSSVSASVWSARTMMSQGVQVYRALPPADVESAARAAIAAVGVGETPGHGTAGSDAVPTATGVSMQLLHRALVGSASSGDGASVLADAVRAAQLYTASHVTSAIPELPAVIATAIAISLGDLGTARSVIRDAIEGRHGGAWAQPRLHLWKAWVAVQSARPIDARNALACAQQRALSPRDELLAGAIRVALARRYEDAAGLERAWNAVWPDVMRAEIDLYLLHPFSELVVSAAKIGAHERVGAHFARAIEIVDRLGPQSLWSPHVHWAGIQRGILLSRPDDLQPHARALVAAATHSQVAARMARAGRVWTSVLAGRVDIEAVEAAARELADVGLAWDGARLAGHAGGRATDRRISVRLLACARELHPTDGGRQGQESETESGGEPAAPGEALSERELEVARLVLQGKTYSEIGEAIFISPRTAEHHIAHIRRRLGVTTRSELIARLRVLIEPSVTPGRLRGPSPNGSP